MKGILSFYESFYGSNFYRHFRRPPDFNKSNFRIQFTVKDPKSLFVHVHRNNGNHPCLIHTYDHGTIDNLKEKKNSIMVFDRVFLDFDVRNEEARKIKNELVKLRSSGLNYKKSLQNSLQEKLQNLVINEKISKPAVNDAKDFAIKIEETFEKPPILFFSGFKGCHAYIFFKPTEFKDINLAVLWFAKHVKKSYGYSTLDLSVTRDAKARLSRVPYSKHQLTDLIVVPFQLSDDYEDIMARSLDPSVENFDIEDYCTNFSEHLQEIDEIEFYNSKIRKTTQKSEMATKNSFDDVTDQLILFKQILGTPVRVYPEKEYVMYHCPFHDHEDKKPSFRVNKKGYYCYGCGRKGNYWDFLKKNYR
ncbi:hypothetical protein Metbo_1134 [Methanobacterium lacus]|uniref:Zinc finger CHC2-type domain-containing protein n=1 Tax=Methanobacterium lacus (strain AL-21) TaxID=877455 RepID=F0T5Y5_METLA|nr:CHC2 zinc finger domain-containing protein [Methanobacterium lacus]ADZ09378.1 hypothetical protein Metbo_1134 [Methanobacterium lacus]